MLSLAVLNCEKLYASLTPFRDGLILFRESFKPIYLVFGEEPESNADLPLARA